jgi:hypothetical protein
MLSDERMQPNDGDPRPVQSQRTKLSMLDMRTLEWSSQ